MRTWIPVAAPVLVGNERAYVLDCLDSNWISSNGVYIERFEREFAAFCGTRHAVSCCNGTAALHVALLALGIGPGDEVIVPTLTFVATVNAVRYCGATPVLVDSEPETWNLDTSLLASLITQRTKAIIAVHLYGHPVDLDPILRICRERRVLLLEDAAEAHGAKYKGRRVGAVGHVGCFSFYGNKVITTGEGGMVVTDDDEVANRARQIKGQGQDPNRRYWFPIVGHNYRMTNIAAAIGVAQLERIEWHLERRRQIAGWYSEFLGEDDRFVLSPEKPWAKSAFWMNSVLLSAECPRERDQVMAKMAEVGVEARPFFYPMHTLPLYRDVAGDSCFPVAEGLAARGINLSSSADLTREEVEFVCRSLVELAT